MTNSKKRGKVLIFNFLLWVLFRYWFDASQFHKIQIDSIKQPIYNISLIFNSYIIRMTLISEVLSLLRVRYILLLNVKLSITLLITLNYNLIILKAVDGRFITLNTYFWKFTAYFCTASRRTKWYQQNATVRA